MKRRTVLLAIATGLAGCTSFGSSEEATPGGDQPLVAAGAADYPHAIRVDNPLDRSIELTLSVEQDGATMYEGQYEVGAGAERTLAGFTKETFPTERRYVTVTAETADGLVGSVGVSVTDCLGNVIVTFDEGGAPRITYSIC